MTKPWQRKDPALFEREKNEVQAEFPELRIRLVGELVVVEGEYPVVVEGVVRDRYSVEITLAKDQPMTLPEVREMAGRIPRDPARHMNANGTACVLLSDERWKSWPVGAPLVEFLKGPLCNYFICQSVVEAGDPWPMEQLPHGVAGVRMFYADILGTEENEVIVAYLACLAATQVKGHWLCPCKSGKRLRNCHLDAVLDLRTKISAADASRSLRYMGR